MLTSNRGTLVEWTQFDVLNSQARVFVVDTLTVGHCNYHCARLSFAVLIVMLVGLDHHQFF